MKSILFVNYEYPPIGAGGANANRHFAINLSKRGHRISVITSAFESKSPRGMSVEESVIVYRIPAFRKYAGRSSLLQMLMYVVSAMIHLPTIIKNESPDAAIVFFGFPCGPLGLLLRYQWRIPYLLMLRGGDVPGFETSLVQMHRILTPLRRSIYRKSHAIIVNGQGLQKMASDADPGYKMHVLCNGVDTEFFTPPAIVNQTTHPFIFLFVGRLCVQKNLQVLLDSFALYQEKRPAAELFIVGEGPELKSLRKQAERLSLLPVITWVGWRSKNELLVFYRKASCFINPSTNEGISNSVLEAMACGLPVIAGDCDGNRELVINGNNGFLFDPRQSADLAKKMSAVANSPDLRTTLGNNGRARCCSQFSWVAATDRLSRLIEVCTIPAHVPT